MSCDINFSCLSFSLTPQLVLSFMLGLDKRDFGPQIEASRVPDYFRCAYQSLERPIPAEFLVSALQHLAHALVEGLLREDDQCQQTLLALRMWFDQSWELQRSVARLIILLVEQFIANLAHVSRADMPQRRLLVDIIKPLILEFLLPAHTRGLHRRQVALSLLQSVRAHPRLLNTDIARVVSTEMCDELVLANVYAAIREGLQVSQWTMTAFQLATQSGPREQRWALAVLEASDLSFSFLSQVFSKYLRDQSLPCLSAQLILLLREKGLIELLHYVGARSTQRDWKRLGEVLAYVDSCYFWPQVSAFIDENFELNCWCYYVLEQLAPKVPRAFVYQHACSILFEPRRQSRILWCPRLLMGGPLGHHDVYIAVSCLTYAFDDDRVGEAISSLLYTWSYDTVQKFRELTEATANSRYTIPVPLAGWIGTHASAYSSAAFAARQLYLGVLANVTGDVDPEPLFSALKLELTAYMTPNVTWAVLQALGKTYYLLEQVSMTHKFVRLNSTTFSASLAWSEEIGAWRGSAVSQRLLKKSLTMLQLLESHRILKPAECKVSK